MLCAKCGKETPDDSKFCQHCGSDIVFPGDRKSETKIDKGIIQSSADNYNWIYEFSFWKNPVVLIATYKIVLLSLLAPALLMFFLTLNDDGITPALKIFISIMGYGVILMTVLLIMGYLLIGLLYGGKYYVLFEMNDKGINHVQLDKQFKKAQALGFLTALLGAASGNVAAGGAGTLGAAKKSLYTGFKNVKSVKIHPRRNTIYLKEYFTHNQVYAEREDFQFVKRYILDHCPKNIKIVEK